MQYTHTHGLGASTSSTTSTSASHAMMPKEATPTLLEVSGGEPKIFGGQNKLLRAPPAVRRRTLSSAGMGNIWNIFQGRQQISAKKEESVETDVVVHDIFGTTGLVPEMGEDMIVV